MRKLLLGLSSLAAAAAFAAPAAQAQGTVKIGIVAPYSGQFADTATEAENGIKLYMKQHGDTVAGKKIEIIRKDVGKIDPAVAKRLTQELIVRDKVDILAGYMLSPNAFAGADITKEAKKFMVIMNAATSAITTHSPYVTRVSMTLPQAGDSLGKWAAQNGVKRAYVMVTDYAPGHDAQASFEKAFKEAGGTIVGAVRMPVQNPDFSAFVQRAKDLNPESIFVFIPGGTQPASLAKALAEHGMSPQKVKILTTGEMVAEQPLKSMGDNALGIISGWHYLPSYQSKMNEEFVKAYKAEFDREPDFFSVGGYDGMHLIYACLEKTKGNTDAQALIDCAKGMSWESPRGMIMIDPATRDIVQNIYINQVEKVDGKLTNVQIGELKDVHDPGKAGAMKK